MNFSFAGLLWTTIADGPTITAAGAASAMPTASGGKYTLPACQLTPLSQLWWKSAGRISCAVTTPGTARHDLRMGSTVVFDTLAMNLNIVAQTTVAWTMDVCMQVRGWGPGTNTTLFGLGTWASAAAVGAPAPTAGGVGVFTVPYNTAPVVGAGWDFTVGNVMDTDFTQTVGTGSFTQHLWSIALVN